MKNSNGHSVTRRELREELTRFATKKDLKETLRNYATKKDIKETLRNYTTHGRKLGFWTTAKAPNR